MERTKGEDGGAQSTTEKRTGREELAGVWFVTLGCSLHNHFNKWTICCAVVNAARLAILGLGLV